MQFNMKMSIFLMGQNSLKMRRLGISKIRFSDRHRRADSKSNEKASNDLNKWIKQSKTSKPWVFGQYVTWWLDIRLWLMMFPISLIFGTRTLAYRIRRFWDYRRWKGGRSKSISLLVHMNGLNLVPYLASKYFTRISKCICKIFSIGFKTIWKLSGRSRNVGQSKFKHLRQLQWLHLNRYLSLWRSR